MLVSSNDLSMKALWTPITKIEDTGDVVEGEASIINTLIIENKMVYIQNEQSFNKIPACAYILDKKSYVKVGDMLDGVFVKKIEKVTDFSDGSTIYLEAYTY